MLKIKVINTAIFFFFLWINVKIKLIEVSFQMWAPHSARHRKIGSIVYASFQLRSPTFSHYNPARQCIVTPPPAVRISRSRNGPLEKALFLAAAATSTRGVRELWSWSRNPGVKRIRPGFGQDSDGARNRFFGGTRTGASSFGNHKTGHLRDTCGTEWSECGHYDKQQVFAYCEGRMCYASEELVGHYGGSNVFIGLQWKQIINVGKPGAGEVRVTLKV